MALCVRGWLQEKPDHEVSHVQAVCAFVSLAHAVAVARDAGERREEQLQCIGAHLCCVFRALSPAGGRSLASVLTATTTSTTLADDRTHCVHEACYLAAGLALPSSPAILAAAWLLT